MLNNYNIHTDLALEDKERFESDNVEISGVSVEEHFDELKNFCPELSDRIKGIQEQIAQNKKEIASSKGTQEEAKSEEKQDDAEIVCSECGQKFSGGLFCPNCGSQMMDGTIFCTNCGSPMTPRSIIVRGERVIAARLIQEKRYAGIKDVHCNAQMTERMIHQYAEPDEAGLNLLRDAMERLSLSARAYNRILKVARTIADLDGSEIIKSNESEEEYTVYLERKTKWETLYRVK